MGGIISSDLVDKEKTSWVIPHKLIYDESLRSDQLSLLRNFGSSLRLCYNDQKILSYPYQHWWITDGKWIIEFGGGSNLENNVIVHCNPRTNYTTDTEFEMTKEVMDRMKKVCGASNYSLALRNCEHLARYIYCGAWICFQMVGSGVLKEYFFNYMSSHTKLINTLPDGLAPPKMERKPLYSLEQTTDGTDAVRIGTITFTKPKEVLTSTDEAAYNIAILGPTGSGKSHLINNLFNLTVCETAASALSVTKQVRFYEGTYSWQRRNNERYTKKVNIIDTIGFCDALMPAPQVLEVIKSSVKVNLTYIDKVVIVCSGRIEGPHSESIKQFMRWLSFSKYKSKFVFVYNKADQYCLQDRVENLSQMCNILGADTTITNSSLRLVDGNPVLTSIKMNLTTGFPPGAKYEEVKNDHIALTHAVLCETTKPSERIPVNKNSCIIL